MDNNQFEKINSALLDLKRHPDDKDSFASLIDQVVQMNNIIHKLYQTITAAGPENSRSIHPQHHRHPT